MFETWETFYSSLVCAKVEERKHSEEDLLVDYEPESSGEETPSHNDGATAVDAARAPVRDAGTNSAGAEQDDDAASRAMLRRLVRLELEEMTRVVLRDHIKSDVGLYMIYKYGMCFALIWVWPVRVISSNSTRTSCAALHCLLRRHLCLYTSAYAR